MGSEGRIDSVFAVAVFIAVSVVFGSATGLVFLAVFSASVFFATAFGLPLSFLTTADWDGLGGASDFTAAGLGVGGLRAASEAVSAFFSTFFGAGGGVGFTFGFSGTAFATSDFAAVFTASGLGAGSVLAGVVGFSLTVAALGWEVLAELDLVSTGFGLVLAVGWDFGLLLTTVSHSALLSEEALTNSTSRSHFSPDQRLMETFPSRLCVVSLAFFCESL
jgi:hypothetical protein